VRGRAFLRSDGQGLEPVERTDEAGLRTTFLRQVNNFRPGPGGLDRATGKPIDIRCRFR